jgi:hypothetical protein
MEIVYAIGVFFGLLLILLGIALVLFVCCGGLEPVRSSFVLYRFEPIQLELFREFESPQIELFPNIIWWHKESPA